MRVLLALVPVLSAACSAEPPVAVEDLHRVDAAEFAPPDEWPEDPADAAAPLDATSTGDAAGPVADAGQADPFAPPKVAVSRLQRALPSGHEVVLYAPDSPASTRLPLLVFAHGFLLGADDYRATFEHIARFGFVVASVDFPETIFSFDHHDAVRSLVDAVGVADTQLKGRVDLSRIAVAGHSVGGKAAVWAAIEDARFKAVVALDPVDDDPSPIKDPKKHPSVTPEMMGGLKVPALLFAAELSAADSCAPRASNACRFAEAATSPATLLVAKGFGHMQFLDNPGCLLCATCKRGTKGAPETSTQDAVRALIVAFLQVTQRGLVEYQPYLDGSQRAALVGRGLFLGDSEQAQFCAMR